MKENLEPNIQDRLESYFLRFDFPYKKVSDTMWSLSAEVSGISNFVVHYDDPIVIFRVKIMEIPSKNKEEFFGKLLRLNAEKMVHGAYGIEGDNIVIIDALEAENLDYNEFSATIDSIIFALTEDYEELKKFLK